MNQAIWDSTPTSGKNILWLHDTLPPDASEELKNFIRHETKKVILKQWSDPRNFPEPGAEMFWEQWKADKENRERENAPPIDGALLEEIKITSAVGWTSLLKLLDAIVKRNLSPLDWSLLNQLILNALKMSYWFYVNTGAWRKQHAGRPEVVEVHPSPYRRPVAEAIDITCFDWSAEPTPDCD